MIAIGDAIVYASFFFGGGLIIGGCIGFLVRFQVIARSIRDQAELTKINAKCGELLREAAAHNTEVARNNEEICEELKQRYAAIRQLEQHLDIQPPEDPREAH